MKPEQPSDNGRVVNLRPRKGASNQPRRNPEDPPLEDLGKYERSDEGDDYRHRMITNVIALVFIVMLVIAGLWIANKMAEMRKNQDCVLSGRRGCSPVDVPPGR